MNNNASSFDALEEGLTLENFSQLRRSSSPSLDDPLPSDSSQDPISQEASADDNETPLLRDSDHYFSPSLSIPLYDVLKASHSLGQDAKEYQPGE